MIFKAKLMSLRKTNAVQSKTNKNLCCSTKNKSKTLALNEKHIKIYIPHEKYEQCFSQKDSKQAVYVLLNIEWQPMSFNEELTKSMTCNEQPIKNSEFQCKTKDLQGKSKEI